MLCSIGIFLFVSLVTLISSVLFTNVTLPGLTLAVSGTNPQTDLGLECWGASRKADVMAKLFQRDVIITDRAQ